MKCANLPPTGLIDAWLRSNWDVTQMLFCCTSKRKEQTHKYGNCFIPLTASNQTILQPVNDLRRGLKAFMIRLKVNLTDQAVSWLKILLQSRHAKQEATTNKPAPLTAGETFVEEADTLKTSMATEPLAASIPSEVLPEGPVPEIQPDEIPSVETSVPQRVQEQTATSVVSGVSMQETPVQESAASRDTKAKVPTQLRKDRIENAVDDVLSSVLNKVCQRSERDCLCEVGFLIVVLSPIAP